MKASHPAPRSLHRRSFLQGVVAISGVAWCGATARAAMEYRDLKTDDYLGDVEVLAKVEGDKVFTEGPTVDRQGTVYFTNIPPNRILRFEPQTRRLSVFRENSNGANGLYFDRQGRLLACEGDARRVTRTDMATGEIEVLADQYDGKPLAAPNDLCVDRQGRIYFTSRSAVEDPPGENPKAVYRIDPDGSLTRVLCWPDVHMPNGIVLSPDEKLLYLVESHPDADHHRDIRVYDVRPEGELENERVLIDLYPGRSADGMCIDAEGNLYLAAGLHKTRGTSETLDTRPGIHVVSPTGRLLAFRETPEDTITNCTFGGPDLRTLYVACGSLLLAIPTKIPGKPAYRPEG